MQHPEDIIQQVIVNNKLGHAAIGYITINKLYKEYRISIANNITIPYKIQRQVRNEIRHAFPKRLKANALVFNSNTNTFFCQIKD